MENEKKLNIFNLSDLTPENVKEIYKRNYERWRYENSSEVIINGEKVEGIERLLMLYPDKNGNPNIKSCTVSDTTKNGFPLTEKTFIDEELKTYEPMYSKTIGSKINRENNLKLKTYIDYIKDRSIRRKDFNRWLLGETDWKEIAYLINTGNKDYQGKQGLIAVFWNSYIYYQQKFEMYYKEFGIIPIDVFNDLIFKFRQMFPKNGRLKGVNYFDDLIEMLIQKYVGNINNKEVIQTQQAETKTEKIKAELGKYGFFELSKVKQVSEPNKQSLIELISTNDLPYKIAMLEYLGFLRHLKAEHFITNYKLVKAIANWFNATERAVKGNISVLNEVSKENRKRYTADQQKKIVQKDYEELK